MQQITARIRGEAVDQFPSDLYIPPEALRVFLEIFEGPLDFLSYLIRKQNIDILNINVAHIATQYSSYIKVMQSLHFELAGDYLAMSAWLTELKSRFLLPRPKHDGDEDEDPRATLIQRLLEYEQMRQGAESMDELPRLERDIFLGSVEIELDQQEKKLPDVSQQDLVDSFADVLRRSSLFDHHKIQGEILSTRERMTYILKKIQDLPENDYIHFNKLYRADEGAAGIVVTLLAIMELLLEACIILSQNQPFGDIYLKGATDVH